MEKPKKDTILQFLMIMIGWIQSVRTLECYDSSYPVPHRRTECGPNMMCYSEYYAVNRSGTIRQYYDRFCVHESHCLYRGIDESCPTLNQLDHKMQSLFTKHHAKSNTNSIRFSEFCCCSTNLCNDVNHKRVYDKYGLLISFADNVFTDASSSGMINISAALAICIITYLVAVL
ncbi:DUF7773 domain-containing protein [Caenorhabditis elegans]|uniref:Protein sleepless n=1 Tax=Caenorhabditis elegans TaxID=6239 RepID=A3FPJ6_CAEEL|nr:Protein sleepless [Caenorhabditis elegans]CCD73078.1 Protein sleepless [Caenorhabditis elegans]|eukprot:NP_001122834.1 Uncharacterized protein CELE_ZK180.7 [Caenorhabditis elegans]